MLGRPFPSGEAGRTAVARRLFETSDVAAFLERLLGEAARQGLTVERKGPDRFVETLLDTRDRRFRRAGTTLVHRDFGEGCEVAWLPLARAGSPRGPLLGTSLALPHAAAQLPEDCPEPLSGALRAVAGRRPLREVLRLEVEREEVVVKRLGTWRGTVVLSEVESSTDPSAPPIARVEWRVGVDAEGAADPFFERLAAGGDLVPTENDACEEARARADSGVRPSRDVGSMELYLGMTTGQLAFAVMRRQFREIVKREPGTRLGADPEELHKMRVAVRRLRAALRLWRPALGGAARDLQQAWGALGRALGATRDLDVEMESSGRWIAGLPPSDRMALAPLETWLAAQRGEARVAMLAALDDPAQERLARATSRWLRVGPPPSDAANRPARREAGVLVREKRLRLLRAARRLRAGSPPEDYHRVRILAKHVRYCLEFHAALLGPATRDMVRGLVALQDLLGEHQDVHVSLDRLRALAEDPAVRLSGRAREILDERAEGLRLRAVELRAAYPDALRRIRGVAWRAVRSELGARG